jgi:transcriptional regulator with XRE-family HTH domain
MQTIHQILAANIRRLLEERAMTAEALAAELDIDKAHVSRVLTCKKQANLDFVQSAAKVLKVEPSELFKQPKKLRG